MAAKSLAAAEIKEATALTDSYTDGWVSGWFNVGDATHARLLLTLVKDGATSVEIKMEVEDNAGSTGFEPFRVASGAAEVDELVVTCSALAATHYLALPVEAVDVRQVRFRAKRTGGDSGTTLAASISVGVIR